MKYNLYPFQQKQQKILFCTHHMLSIADLNKIIKFYAYRMQQRIEELSHFDCYKTTEESEDEQQYEFLSVLSRYTHYATTDEREVRLMKQFKERAMQIFEFFKSKSSNQNTLSIIQNRIEREILTFVNATPLQLGDLLSYIHLITKRGCIVKPPPTATRKIRILSKPTIKEPPRLNEKAAPSYCIFNLQRQENAPSKHVRAGSTEKWKIQELISELWSGIDFDKGQILRIREGKENLIAKDMLRRNEKIMAEIKKNQRRRVRLDSSEVFRESTILTEVKVNTSKAWTSKKKRTLLLPRQRNSSTKQNISLFA